MFPLQMMKIEVEKAASLGHTTTSPPRGSGVVVS